jgi:hypothetical protein
MMLERYDGWEIEQDEDGSYVRFDEFLMCESRAERAEAELAALHDYLDTVLLPGSGDQGRAVPALDRVLLLVSTLAGDRAEVARLREQVRVLKTGIDAAYAYLDEAVGEGSDDDDLNLTFAIVREVRYEARDGSADAAYCLAHRPCRA